MSVEAFFKEKRVVIVGGAGGVGKTTSAAALALAAAAHGRKVAVLTVDPARRLAQALGVEQFGEEAQRLALPPEARTDGGELWVMRLNVRRTYDRLLRLTIKDPEQIAAIEANKFYRHFTQALGGTHEYSALERLYELVSEGRYDLVVLDTPPSTQALDFLSAPKRLTNAFNEPFLNWLGKPANGKGAQGPGFAMGYVFKTLKRFAGEQLIDELQEFLALFRDMLAGFRSRAERVESFLHAPSTAFWVVSSPSFTALKEAAVFGRELRNLSYPLEAFLVNRVTEPLPVVPEHEHFASLCPEDTCHAELLATRLGEAARLYNLEALAERENIRRFLAGDAKNSPVFLAPLTIEDPTDLPALLALARSMRRLEAP